MCIRKTRPMPRHTRAYCTNYSLSSSPHQSTLQTSVDHDTQFQATFYSLMLGLGPFETVELVVPLLCCLAWPLSPFLLPGVTCITPYTPTQCLHRRALAVCVPAQHSYAARLRSWRRCAEIHAKVTHDHSPFFEHATLNTHSKSRSLESVKHFIIVLVDKKARRNNPEGRYSEPFGREVPPISCAKFLYS